MNGSIHQGWSISKEFQHKGHFVEIAQDRSCYGLTYIVTIDGEYAGDIHNTLNVAIDSAKAIVNRLVKLDTFRVATAEFLAYEDKY